MARPSREFAPAGDLLSERPESRQRVAPEPPAPRTARGSLRCAVLEAPRKTPVAAQGPLWSNSCAESELEACWRTRPQGRTLLGGTQRGSEGTAMTSRVTRVAIGCSAVWDSPFETAEKHRRPRRAPWRASTSDSAQLFDQSVAEGVLRGPRSSSIAGHPPALRVGGFAGAISLPTFLFAQESRSPARANSGHGPMHQANFGNR
jgi:hypothetical protein